MWYSGEQDRRSWWDFKFREGQLLECGVRDDGGRTQGTILVKVLKKLSTESNGSCVECRFISASDSHYRWWSTEGPGKSLAAKGVYHFCEGRSADCGATHGRRQVIHSEKFRLIGPDEIRANTPSWAFGRSCKASTQPFFQEVLDRESAFKKGDPSLPWMTKQDLPVESPEEDSSSSEEEDDDEDESISDKIKKLREELKRAEDKALKKKQADKQKEKERQSKKLPKEPKKKDDDSGKKKKVKKRKKKKGAASSTSDGKKKKKTAKEKDTGKKRKKRDSSTPDPTEEEEEELFGPGPASSRVTPKLSGRDRGPFGSGEPEKFKLAETDDEETEPQLFREASTQNPIASQMKLEEYSKKYPGRLAARMLLRMSRETALHSVGALKEAREMTPPAARHYLQTIMAPSLGSKMNIRTSRELLTLCSVLDCMAQGLHGQGADILGQRVKALERATQEGHWQSAQFLELIGSDQATLLDRSEQVFLAKEFLLEKKVRDYDKAGNKNQGKGDQKGGKGKGPKGQSEKGNKGKDKSDAAPKT